MSYPELDLPAEPLELRLSSAVEIFLDVRKFELVRELKKEARTRHEKLEDGRSVYVSQTRKSPEDTRVMNTVHLMDPDAEGDSHNYVAGWYMGEEGFTVNTFGHPDDIEKILHETKITVANKMAERNFGREFWDMVAFDKEREERISIAVHDEGIRAILWTILTGDGEIANSDYTQIIRLISMEYKIHPLDAVEAFDRCEEQVVREIENSQT